jgi:hypothetical protein
MYKIRATGNYNVILKDIGIYFTYPTVISITEEQYSKSKDLKVFIASGIVVVETNELNGVENNVPKIESNDNPSFVREGNELFNNTGSFIREEENATLDEKNSVVIFEETLSQELSEIDSEKEQFIGEQIYSSNLEDGNYSVDVASSIEAEELTEEIKEVVSEEKEEVFPETKKNSFVKRKYGKK